MRWVSRLFLLSIRHSLKEYSTQMRRKRLRAGKRTAGGKIVTRNKIWEFTAAAKFRWRKTKNKVEIRLLPAWQKFLVSRLPLIRDLGKRSLCSQSGRVQINGIYLFANIKPDMEARELVKRQEKCFRSALKNTTLSSKPPLKSIRAALMSYWRLTKKL